jgi:6-phosphogluconolactonase
MSGRPDFETEILGDPEKLARRVAEWLLATAAAKQGRFVVALSGGSTPKRLYELLVGTAFPWARTHWFWGDERFVPHDDPRSNYRMTREAMLSQAPIPEANIHAMPTEHIAPEAAAAAYDAELKAFYGQDRLDPARPLFDVTLLGLGPDGHTASLFPGTAVLGERHKWVAAVLDGKLEPRITLTYPALESSRTAAFLVAGAEKHEMLARLLAGDRDLPAARLAAVGKMRLFADTAAAGRSVP